MATSGTPTKTCVLGDICVLCGFGFLEYETTVHGEKVVHKHFDKKLRMTTERAKNILKVTELNFSSDSAVCQKCYRTVESVLRSEQKNEEIRTKICSMAQNTNKTLLLQLPSPRRKLVTKRMLRSPVVAQVAKRGNCFNIAAVEYKAVKIAPFTDITNQTNTCSSTSTEKPKIVRRSLEFKPNEPSNKEQHSTVLQGEIEVRKLCYHYCLNLFKYFFIIEVENVDNLY